MGAGRNSPEESAGWNVSSDRNENAFLAPSSGEYSGTRHQRRAPIATGGSIEPGTYTYWSKRLYIDVSGEFYFYQRLAVFASLRNIGDAPDDVQVYGPSTPEHAQFRQRIAFGSLWMFGVKGTF